MAVHRLIQCFLTDYMFLFEWDHSSQLGQKILLFLKFTAQLPITVVFEVCCSTSHHSLLFLKFSARLPITKRVNKVRNIAFYHIMLQNYVQYRVRSPKSQKYKNCFLSVCVKVLLRSTQKYCVIYPLFSCAPVAIVLIYFLCLTST